jgi:hypothetical protein
MKKRDKKTPHTRFNRDTTGAFINEKKGQEVLGIVLKAHTVSVSIIGH